ncbi:MAG: prepilin-type N-terminal cleavage/methylation domain-containing protein [bacterium]
MKLTNKSSSSPGKTPQSTIRNPKLRLGGFTLVEVMISALLLVIGIVAVYSAVVWGKYYTRKNQYVVIASGLGRNEMEEIKAFGIYNADTTHHFTFSTSTGMAEVYVIHPRSQSIVNPDFDTETRKYTLPSDSKVVVFESIVYLHGTDTTDVKFANPIVSYQTQMVVGGI